MTSPDGVTHTFDSGSFALELLLTGGPPPWDRYEILHTPEALADWVVDSHLALELPFAREDLRITRAELARIKEFRGVLWRLVPSLTNGSPLPVTQQLAKRKTVPAGKAMPGGETASVDGKVLPGGEAPTATDLEIVNRAVGPLPRPRLNPLGTKQWEKPITGTQILGAAARELVDLIGTEKANRVRMCEGVNCYLMFYDTSRPGNRRWCSMQRCGNRHKVGAYRSRHFD